MQEDLERFRMYNASALEFKRSEMSGLNLTLCIVPHALKLSLKHRSLIFLHIALHSILKSNAQ